MKDAGIRVRCSQCDFVFRAGPPSPGEKYAKVLARRPKTKSRPKTLTPSVPSDAPVQNHLDTPEAPTRAGLAGPNGFGKNTISKSEFLPPKSASLLGPPAVPPPPLPAKGPESGFSNLFSSPSLPAVPPSSPAAPVDPPPPPPPPSGSGDLFETHASSAGQRGVAVPELRSPDRPVSSNLDFDALFPGSDSPESALPDDAVEFGALAEAPDIVPQSSVNRITAEFMSDMESASTPVISEIPLRETSSAFDESQALGKIQLNKARTRRDGSMETVRRTSSLNVRTSSFATANVVEPGRWLRSVAVFFVVVSGLAVALILSFPSILEGSVKIDSSLFSRTINWASERINSSESSRQAQYNLAFYGVANPGPNPFKLVDLVVAPFRIGQTDRDVLMIRGRALNTSAAPHEDVSVLADIVQNGASIRRTMTTLGHHLDDRRLATVRTKNDLAEIWDAARVTARENGHRIAPAGETREFTFVLWDVPTEIEQSAIYVAFRPRRGTVKR